MNTNYTPSDEARNVTRNVVRNQFHQHGKHFFTSPPQHFDPHVYFNEKEVSILRFLSAKKAAAYVIDGIFVEHDIAHYVGERNEDDTISWKEGTPLDKSLLDPNERDGAIYTLFKKAYE